MPQPPIYPYPLQGSRKWSVTGGGVPQTSDSYNPPPILARISH